MREQSTGFVILGVLAIGGDLSGYEIRQWIEQAIGFFWRESFGQIYPELRRLSEAGLAKPLGEAGGGRKTKRYRITAKGHKALGAWLARPAAAERTRNETLLKLFFGAVTGAAPARALLDATESVQSGRLKAIAAAENLVMREDRTSANLVYSLITILSGRLVYAARLKWARAARGLIDAADEGGNEAVLRAYARLKKQFDEGG